jgi:plastocyanin
MSHRTGRRALAIVAGSLCAVAIGIAGAAAATSAATISGFAFHPNPIVVTAGDTVTWTNNDPVGHTVTANGASFASGTIANGASFSHTFGVVGSFPYHCSIHPTMTGTVTVNAAPTPPPTAPPTAPPTRTPRPTGTRVAPPPTDTATAGPSNGAGSVGLAVALLAAIGTASLLMVGRRRQI